MVLDISNKGRKRRLINDAVIYLNGQQNTIINLVSNNIDISIEIKSIIIDTCKCDVGRVIISDVMLKQKITGSREVKNYVYNFNLINETKLFIDEDAYFTTIPDIYTFFSIQLITFFKNTYNRTIKINKIIND